MNTATEMPVYFSLGYAAEKLSASPDAIVGAMREIGATFAEVRNGVGVFDAEAFAKLQEHFQGTDQ